MFYLQRSKSETKRETLGDQLKKITRRPTKLTTEETGDQLEKKAGRATKGHSKETNYPHKRAPSVF
jgi:hypothetical protein